MTDGKIVPLGAEPPGDDRPPASPPGRLHAVGMLGMASSALLGIIGGVAYVTVTWSGAPRRVLIALLLFSALTFLVSGSIAVLSAARDTYARPGPR